MEPVSDMASTLSGDECVEFIEIAMSIMTEEQKSLYWADVPAVKGAQVMLHAKSNDHMVLIENSGVDMLSEFGAATSAPEPEKLPTTGSPEAEQVQTEANATTHKKKNARKNNRDGPSNTHTKKKKKKKKQTDLDTESGSEDEGKDSPTMLIRVNRVAWTTAQARFPGKTAAATFERLITECNSTVTTEGPDTLRRAIIDLQRITAELELFKSSKTNHSIQPLPL